MAPAPQHYLKVWKYWFFHDIGNRYETLWCEYVTVASLPNSFDWRLLFTLGLASTIKTHHNDTNLVRKLRQENRVVEPLKDFHKDEVNSHIPFS